MNHSGEKQNRITGLLLGLLALISVDFWLFSTMGYSVAGVFAVLFLLLGAFVKIENAFYLYIFCFPFASILKLSQTGISILPILNLIIILRLLWKGKVRISLLQLLALFGLLILQLLCVLLYDARMQSVGSFFISLLFLACSASYFTRQQDRQDIFGKAALFYIVSILSGVVLCDVFPDSMYLIAAKKQTALVYDGRFGSVFVEPNEFAQAVLVGMGLVVTVFPRLRKHSEKLLAIAVFAYMGLSGYRTLSKSFVLTYLGLFVVFLLMHWYRIGKYKGMRTAVLNIVPGLVVMGIGVWLILEKIVFPTFAERNAADFWTGRGEIWLWYIDAIFQRMDVLLWGCGMGNANYLSSVNGLIAGKVPHNIYLEYFAQLGLCGMILLAVFLSRWIRRNANKLSSYFLLVLAAFLVTAFGISSNANDCVFVVLLFMVMPFSELPGNKANEASTHAA